MQKLIREGKENSHVWDTLVTLAEVIGPRLTGSTRAVEANAWTRDEFRRYGLANSHLDKWGEIPVRFDRGRSYARMDAPGSRLRHDPAAQQRRRRHELDLRGHATHQADHRKLVGNSPEASNGADHGRATRTQWRPQV